MILPLRRRDRVLLLLLLLLPLIATADDAAGSDPAATEAEQSLPTDSPEPDADETPVGPELPFDAALVGLPGLPWPMIAPEDFQQALDLIDARLAEAGAARDAATAAVAEAEAQAEDGAASAGEDVEPTDQDTDAVEEQQTDVAMLAAAVTLAEQRIEALQELRITVQRNATLSSRVAGAEAKLEHQRAQAETQSATLEPPYPVSLLDQLQAELTVKQALESVAETRVASAERRKDSAQRGLSQAVRERRTARDRQAAAESDGGAPADRAALDEALELARLQELVAREHLAAMVRAADLARIEDDTAEIEQTLITERIRFLEERVTLPQEVLGEQLAELEAAKDRMRGELDALQHGGDKAEADLFRAQRRLAKAEAEADGDQAAMSEWVAARQAELIAARASVDNLAMALDVISRMQDYWELRYQVMNDPDALDLGDLVRRVISDLAQARSDKESIIERLNALRSIQLAQARRARDPSLGEGVREAMAVRSAAHDLAERHGRELLEAQDELIALLAGMRHQLELRLREHNLSLKLLQVQETLTGWWDAEIIVIDDQSIRVRELVSAMAMFFVVLLIVSLIRMAARRALRRRKQKSLKTEYGDLRLVLSAIAGNTNQLFVLIAAFYVAMTFSGLASPTVARWLWTTLVIAFYAQLGIWANAAMVDYFTRRRTRQEMRDPSTVTGYGLLTFFLRVGIWITVVVSLLAYFKYPVAGLVGALGVGSLAIAFAVQNILGDIFSSMAIILDKPFRVGDFIKTGETLGTIENIGVKTTRIRSLSGEQIVLSNSDLLNSRIHNFKHFRERRIVFRIGVIYQTPRVQLERIPHMLREAVEEVPDARFDRAHFAEYGDFSLNFEIVYYVQSPDYAVYMDTQQAINLGIHRRFEEAGVSFAYPTQELILRRGGPMLTASTA